MLKTNHIKRRRIMFILLIVLLLCAIPTQGLASQQLPLSSSSRIIDVPPKDEISENASYSEAFVLTRSGLSGGCSISGSSNSVIISGHTSCAPANPAVKITLRLQMYYNGSWVTLASPSKQLSGTYVYLSKKFGAASGYYYRVYAIHSISGTTATSVSRAIFIR